MPGTNDVIHATTIITEMVNIPIKEYTYVDPALPTLTEIESKACHFRHGQPTSKSATAARQV
jgi:hypothetical protein